MSKHLSNIVFSLFLLFQTASLAEEINEDPQENMIKEAEPAPEATESQEATEAEGEAQEEEPQEEISEAMREAQAAEEAELREAGIGEEPVPE